MGVADQVERSLCQPLGGSLVLLGGRLHPNRPQPPLLDRHVEEVLERLLGCGPEVNRFRVRQQVCLNEVRPRELKIDELFLEGGVVPKGDQHRLVFRNDLSFDQARRNDELVDGRFRPERLAGAALDVAGNRGTVRHGPQVRTPDGEQHRGQ